MTNNSFLGKPQTITINENEHLTEVFKRNGYALNAIPTNCIFDKTLPGLGATYSEIKAQRNSIIIEPNVPVIKGKAKDNKGVLGVYENVTKEKIKNYLLNTNIKYKKIICTPESYVRIQKIAKDNGADLFEDYFCMFDECEKIIQDIDFRGQISQPMEDFFLFKEKAFVSATPLQALHPKFKEQKFYILKIEPTFDYRKNIDLIITGDFFQSVSDLFTRLKESECVCVFMNSTTGIGKLVELLKTNGITDYKVFCSKKSMAKSKAKEIFNSYEDLDYPLARFNFFTSRFFSAVDILSPSKPDIVILTDLKEAEYTMIDPFTNAIQIYGRFRNAHNDGEKFNSLAHLSDYGINGNIMSESVIRDYIGQAKKTYEYMTSELNKLQPTNMGRRSAMGNNMASSAYNSKFLDKDGALNYFKIDNFYDEHRVKSYYQNPQTLHNAYNDTNHFVINYSTEYLFMFGDGRQPDYQNMKNSVDRRKSIIEQLELIHTSTLSSKDKESAEARFYNGINPESPEKVEEIDYNIKAYRILGKAVIAQCKYQKVQIDKLLEVQEEQENEQKMSSREVKDEILSRFGQNTKHRKEDLFDGFKEIFQKRGITIPETQFKLPLIKRYYHIRQLKSNGGNLTGEIQLHGFKP